MRYSKLFTKTRKKAPAGEVTVNAKLLIRAGFINKLMAGAYSYLPLGLRVLKKIEAIVREEMDTIGGQEVFLPSLHPAENWKKTGGWESIDILFKIKSRTGRDYALGQSHEEVITPLLKEYIKSYKDLPLFVYQIQNKYRDELRSKSGILRGREFGMKDMYSFHLARADFEKFYEIAKKAYLKVFARCGLKAHVTEASGGSFTEKVSFEFMVPTEAGEDDIFYAKSKNLYFNQEVAPSQAPPVKYEDKKMMPKEDVLGRGIVGVEALAKFLAIPVEKTTKTLLFETEKNEVIAAAVRGGYNINEEKLRRVVGCRRLQLARVGVVKRITGAAIGYAGILNLPKKVRVFMDESMKGRLNFETGANKTNYHTINVNFGRDLPAPKRFFDIKMARKGDLYPATGEVYEVFRASEAGNVFDLGDKYTRDFDLYVLDKKGKKIYPLMGCYGIGTTRLMGVIVEKFHDDQGIIWPEPVAPFLVHILTLGTDKKTSDFAERVYKTLSDAGVEVLFDDRKGVSAGEKFADSDLIGIPYRLVVSEETIKKEKIEVKKRDQKKSQLLSLPQLLKKLSG